MTAKLQTNSLEWQAMPMITQFLSEKQTDYRSHKTLVSLGPIHKVCMPKFGDFQTLLPSSMLLNNRMT